MLLNGKTVLFLGSSVTCGSAAGGISFAEIMEERCGIRSIKEAVSGTTLADIDGRSYVSRLKTVDKSTHVDLFICQLSTNDATKQIEPQKIEEAICFIVEYVRDVFGCPIVFYTGTYYESEAYGQMVQLLYRLQARYGFSILDLYNDEDMRAVSREDYRRYMRDPIHPTVLGYREWWTPKFIRFCEQLPQPLPKGGDCMLQKAVRADSAQIAALAAQMWNSSTVDELTAEFRATIEKNDAAVFLCREGEAVIGFAQCGLRHDYVEGTGSSPVGYLEGVFVEERFRRRGCAKALVQACQSWAKELGCTEFASDCELTNADSLQFHLRCGFAEANRIICFTKKL